MLENQTDNKHLELLFRDMNRHANTNILFLNLKILKFATQFHDKTNLEYP